MAGTPVSQRRRVAAVLPANVIAICLAAGI